MPLLPSLSASCVTLDLSLLLRAPLSPSAPSSLALAAGFPRLCAVREDEELQIHAQSSEPEAESNFHLLKSLGCSVPTPPSFPCSVTLMG